MRLFVENQTHVASIVIAFHIHVRQLVLACKLDYSFLGFKERLGAFWFRGFVDSKANPWFWWMIQNSGARWRRGKFRFICSWLWSTVLCNSFNFFLKVRSERIALNIFRIIPRIFACSPLFSHVLSRWPVGNFSLFPFVNAKIFIHARTNMSMEHVLSSYPGAKMEGQNSGVLKMIVRHHCHCRLYHLQSCSGLQRVVISSRFRLIARQNDKMRSGSIVVECYFKCVAFLVWGHQIKWFLFFMLLSFVFIWTRSLPVSSFTFIWPWALLCSIIRHVFLNAVSSRKVRRRAKKYLIITARHENFETSSPVNTLHDAPESTNQ